MMESGDHEKYLVDKSDINSVITEALLIEKPERQEADYIPSWRETVDILAAEVVRLRDWSMWMLSPEDIQWVYHDMGVWLTSEQMIEVRRLFKKAMQCNNENWTDILEDAIEEVCDNE